MKNFGIIGIIVLCIGVFSCSTPRQPTGISQTGTAVAVANNDTIRIANDELQYEIIIIDPGFNSWLIGRAKPRGFYTQSYLESRNIPWVTEWNTHVISPRRGQEDLFQMAIDYRSGTDYGYEVNYMLYNYLVYFQLKNNIRLGVFAPRP